MDDFRLYQNYYGILIILMFRRTPVGFVKTIVALGVMNLI